MEKFVIFMFIIWVFIILGAFAAHIVYGVPCI